MLRTKNFGRKSLNEYNSSRHGLGARYKPDARALIARRRSAGSIPEDIRMTSRSA